MNSEPILGILSPSLHQQGYCPFCPDEFHTVYEKIYPRNEDESIDFCCTSGHHWLEFPMKKENEKYG